CSAAGPRSATLQPIKDAAGVVEQVGASTRRRADSVSPRSQFQQFTGTRRRKPSPGHDMTELHGSEGRRGDASDADDKDSRRFPLRRWKNSPLALCPSLFSLSSFSLIQERKEVSQPSPCHRP